MAEWRLFNSWSPEAIKARLEEVKGRPLNFDAVEEDMTGASGWHHYHSEAVIAREPLGDECFRRASVALANYQFSDPGIVLAHFEPDAPLLNRRILLEIQEL